MKKNLQAEPTSVLSSNIHGFASSFHREDLKPLLELRRFLVCYINSLSCFLFKEQWHKRTLRSSTTRVWESTLTSPCTSPSCPRRRDAAHEPWLGPSARSSSITSSFFVTSSFREAAEKPLVWENFCNRPISSSQFTIRAPSQVRTNYSAGSMLLQNTSVLLILNLEDYSLQLLIDVIT